MNKLVITFKTARRLPFIFEVITKPSPGKPLFMFNGRINLGSLAM